MDKSLYNILMLVGFLLIALGLIGSTGKLLFGKPIREYGNHQQTHRLTLICTIIMIIGFIILMFSYIGTLIVPVN